MDDSTELTYEVSLLGTLNEKLRNLKGLRTLVSELIQNADDSKGIDPTDRGATEMEFLLDTDLLTVSNNGTFREQDFDRLKRIASGGKRDEEDTTGAFGIGFIAVYQITDHPELLSAGRHWTFNPEQASISQRAIPEARGTLFRFPWAKGNTDLRKALGVAEVTDATLGELLGVLDETLPLALLFLKKVEVIRFGLREEPMREIRRLLSPETDEVLIQLGERDDPWQLLRGDFAGDAQAVRGSPGARVEKKRKSDVMLVIRQGEPLPVAQGRFFATLPTQEATWLPFHIQADFFPSSDRKTLIWEKDFQGEWNRAAVRAAARILAKNLARLPKLLGQPEHVLGLLNRVWGIQKEATDAASPLGNRCLDEFWRQAEPEARKAAIVLTSNEGWNPPTLSTLLHKDDEAFRPVAAKLGLRVAVPALWTHQNLLTHLGGKILKPTILAEAISAGVPTPIAVADAPEWLRAAADYQLLAEEVWRLLKRHQDPQSTSHMENCISARGSDGKFHAPAKLLLASEETQRVFAPLGFSTPFVTTDTPDVFRGLTPELTAKRAMHELAALPPGRLLAVWTQSPEAIRQAIGWFANYQEELRSNAVLRNLLRQLPIWPSGSGLHPLARLIMPGGFQDNLQLAQLLDSQLVQQHGDFLRMMDVRVLTVRDYVTTHVPHAFAGGAKPPDAILRGLADLLASRLNDFRDMADARQALAACPLVECMDNQFRRGAEVYFLEAGAAPLLGRPVAVARVPADRPKAVRQLLLWLGVALRPRVKDLLARVAAVTAKPPTAESQSAVNQIVAHLMDRWTDQKSPEIWKELKDRSWLMAQGDESRWYRPSDLHAIYSRHLFYKSKARFLKLDHSQQNQKVGRDLLDFLGVKTGEPPVGLVVEHLLECAKTGEKVNSQLWWFLDRHSEEPALDQLLRQCCLLLEDDTYVAPQSVFLNDHGLGRFARQLSGDSSLCKQLLARLNVRELPGASDALRVLEELEHEFGAGNIPLDDPRDRDVAWYCWKLLESADEAALRKLRNRKVILNDQNILRTPETLLLNDRPTLAPRFSQYLLHDLIPRREGIWRALVTAGVGLLSGQLKIQLVAAENLHEAETFRALLRERHEALARVLDVLPPDADGRSAVSRLEKLDIKFADEIQIRQVLHWHRAPPDLEPESVLAHAIPESNKLHLTNRNSDHRYWAVVARSLLNALSPETEASSLSAPLMYVLSAPSLAEAQTLLNDWGYAPLDAQAITGVSSEESVRRSGDNTSDDVAGEGIPSGNSPKDSSGTSTDEEGTDEDVRFSDAEEDEGEDEGERNSREDGDEDGKSGSTTRAGRRRQTGGIKTGGIRGDDKARGHGDWEKPSQQTRLVSYVVPHTGDSHDGEVREVLEEDDWQGLGNLGVGRVASDETRRLSTCTGYGKWDVKIMPPNYPGYDIEVWIDDAVERYIEVKSLRGAWGTRGVGMTAKQFEHAQKWQEKYWLYVVEEVESSNGAVTRIQDPATRVTRFQFDGGWKPLGT